MRARISYGLVLGIAVGLMLPAGGLRAQEHPAEHPKSAEHPKGAAKGVTKEELGAAIEAYIKGEMAKGGGAWEVEDKVETTTLHLTLDKDHLAVTEVSVHKKDGKERYTWAKDGNVWKKVPVAKT